MGWQVLYLRPKTEKKMARYCSVMNIEHYLPLRKKTKVFQRRKVTTMIPLFPGYIFAVIESSRVDGMKRSDFVLKFIAPDNEESLLKALNQIKTAITVDPEMGAAEKIKKGTKVRIINGPLAGIEGEVSTLKGNIKVMLNVDIIGKAAAVETTRECIEVIE